MIRIESITFSEEELLSGAFFQADDLCHRIIEDFAPTHDTREPSGLHRFWIGVEAAQLINRELKGVVHPTEQIVDVRTRMDWILRIARSS